MPSIGSVICKSRSSASSKVLWSASPLDILLLILQSDLIAIASGSIAMSNRKGDRQPCLVPLWSEKYSEIKWTYKSAHLY